MMQKALFATAAAEEISLINGKLLYQPDFIAAHERHYERLRDSTSWRQDRINFGGKIQPVPRLTAWYGDADAAYQYSGIQLSPLPWTEQLTALKKQVEQQLGTVFNSVLLNWYRDGRDSVAWHSDDEAELGPAPTIASLSFGATRCFRLRHKNRAAKPLAIDLQDGSLLTMMDETQRYWQHCVAKENVDGGRINLTFRRIDMC